MRDKKNEMEVHHIIAGLNVLRAGSAASVAKLCENLVDFGVHTSIHTLNLGPAFGEQIIPNRKDVIIYNSKCWVSKDSGIIVPLGFGANLKRNASSVTALHSHGIWLPINHSSAKFAQKSGVPHIISPRGMLETWALKYKAIKKKMAWYLYQKEDLMNATAFCASSIKEAESIRRLGFKQPIAVIPNGVDLQMFPKEINNKCGSFNALFLSRLHPVKGVLDLIEAWRHFKESGYTKNNRWRLKIAGPAEEGYKTKILDVINKGNLQKDIDLLGPVYGNEKQKLFSEADLFVFPTYSENFGNVVVEALAAGVPVITTKGAPWQELEEHNCGWWTEVGVEGCYGALMVATAISEHERNEMGLRGKRLVEAKYSWPSVAGRMVEFYHWLVKKRSRPGSLFDDF